MKYLGFMAFSVLLTAQGAIAQNLPQAPVANKVSQVSENHGDTRQDNYAWLRDDSRQNESVLNYLRQENTYTEQVSAQWKELKTQVYQEMQSRQVQDNYAQPVRQHNYLYKSEYSAQANFPQILRKKDGETVWETVIDTVTRSEGKAYYSLGRYALSEDNRFIAVAEDYTGDGQYQIAVFDIEHKQWLKATIHQASDDIVFSNNGKQLYYVQLHPQTQTPYKVMRYDLNTAKAQTVWQENDGRFYTGIARSASEQFLLITASANDTSEVRYLSLEDSQAPVKLLRPRATGMEYYADHANGYFYIRSNHESKNFALYRAKVNENWQSVLAPDSEKELEGFTLFARAVVVSQRYDGKTHYRKLGFASQQWQELSFPDPTYMARTGSNGDGNATVFNYIYSSLDTPLGYYQWDLESGKSTLIHQKAVPGLVAGTYTSRLIYVKARDGERVPVSLIWRKDRFNQGHNPLLVYGYGAYGMSLDAAFSAPRMSLLDRGFVFALAHVRGGGEKGVAWYLAGKKEHKQNSFNDLIDATRGLVKQGYGAADRVYGMGGSAGGLLLAGAVNQAPELFRAVVLQVPFVDVLNTMLDKSLPLTQQEYSEWGNPNVPAEYAAIKAWSPYDNIHSQAYPSLLVTTGLYDSRVPYWEAAKYVARLRAANTDKNTLQLLSVNMNSGHSGRSGRYSRLEDSAQAFSFLIFVDSQKNK